MSTISCLHSHKYLSSADLTSKMSSSDSSSSSGGDTTTSGISRWTCGALSVESKCREDGGVLRGVGMGLCAVPGRRWFSSMETLESLLWDRLEIEPPSFRRELRDADKPSPSERREDGEERGGWFKRKEAFWEVIRDAEACNKAMRTCSSACLGMGNREETRKKMFPVGMEIMPCWERDTKLAPKIPVIGFACRSHNASWVKFRSQKKNAKIGINVSV